MNEQEPVIEKRISSQIGLNLYFYSFRTLALFNYEVSYQITDGLWSSPRYGNHATPWIEANLYLTQGKSNARNVVDMGCRIIKNDYNLKKMLNLSTAYRRIEAIGKLVNCCDDYEYVNQLLHNGFHEAYDELIDEWNEWEYYEMINRMLSNPDTRDLAVMLTPELIQCYIESVYTEDEMRDDLGMIQNTMRNVTSLNYQL